MIDTNKLASTHRPVFISYARSSSRAFAQYLHQALGGDQGLSFLDTSGIETDDRFPSVLADALLNARIVIIFITETYFKRWYCLRELRIALSPFQIALQQNLITKESADSCLSHIVIALPVDDTHQEEMSRLPSALKTTNCKRANETQQLAEIIKARLDIHPTILSDRLDAMGANMADKVRKIFLEESGIPQPGNLSNLLMYPLEMPPSIGESFVGRADELWQIDFLLSTMRGNPAAGAALTGAVEGGGGIGKTRLVVEYLHRFGPLHFPGGLFWINADVDDSELEKQFHGILQCIKPETPDLKAFRECQRDAKGELGIALHMLSNDKPMLFIVDNLPEPAIGACSKPVQAWCPAVGKVALLLTSRLRISLGRDKIYSVPMDVLSPEAGVMLLKDGVTQSVSKDSWLKIAEWVGYLPLALELLNRAIRASGITPRELLSKIHLQSPVQELDRQMEALRTHIPSGSLRGVTEALMISYERMPGDALAIAHFLAACSPDPIPLVLLDTIFSRPNQISEGISIRDTLIARSFISPMNSGDVPFFGTMHRLLADFLFSITGADEVIVLLGACMVFEKIMQPRICRDSRQWPVMNACLPHAQRVFDRLVSLNHIDTHTVRIGQEIGILLLVQGLSHRAEAMFQLVSALALNSLGPKHLETITSKSFLAEALIQLGNLSDARLLLEEAVKIMKPYGLENLFTLTVMFNLSVILKQQNELSRARELLEQIVAVEPNPLDEDEYLKVLDNLAGVLQAQGDQGDIERARSLREKALDTSRRRHGDAHYLSLDFMNNLAHTMQGQKDFTAARNLQRKVLYIYRRELKLSVEHPYVLNIIHNLAYTLLLQGKLCRAQMLLEKILKLKRDTLGNNHIKTALTMYVLALTLEAIKTTESLKRACSLSKEALDVLNNQLGPEHPITAEAATCYFRILMQLKKQE